MKLNKKVWITITIIGLFLISMAISFAYFSARIIGNESESTIVGTAAYLELTFTDGEKQINASNIVPGWSESKTFKVENTGENTAYYVIRISDITNPYIYGSISYDIVGDNNVTIEKDTLPLMEMPVSSVIEIPVNTTHNYTITTYYNNLEESQLKDLGKSFSYTVSIEAVYKKEINYIEDLVDLSNEVNAGNSYAKTWFLQTRDLDFNNDASYKNANNMSYGDINGNGTVENIKTELTTGSGFIPIGTSTNRFYGSYDGQNHRIDNLYEYNATGRPGLFGYTSNNIFRDLTVSGSISNYSTSKDISGIIGNITIGVLYNLINEVNVYSDFAGSSVGGIIGAVVSKVYIKNCINKGTISNGNNTGGITGYNGGSLIFENSHNEGKINKNKGANAGGLLGRDNAISNSTIIVNSSNKEEIIINDNNKVAKNIGGLIGLVYGYIGIDKSHNDEKIINNTEIYNSDNDGISLCFGGLIGRISSSSATTNIINNSYNIADIGPKGNRIGGIIGYLNSGNIIINKSYNAGDLSSEIYTGRLSTILGGIIGYQISPAIIINSFNTGNIEYSGLLAPGGNYVGGLTGFVKTDSKIINSYNIGNLINVSTVSGIIGVLPSNGGANIIINNAYSNATNISGAASYGIICLSSNENTYLLSNTYYLDTSASQGANISNGENINITPKTSAYMSSTAFVNELNQNKRAIDLTTEYDGVLADYELSDWKYDSAKGYPVLDN